MFRVYVRRTERFSRMQMIDVAAHMARSSLCSLIRRGVGGRFTQYSDSDARLYIHNRHSHAV
jgi:hypothetical protein